MTKKFLFALAAFIVALQSPVATAQSNNSSQNQLRTNPQHNGWLGVTIRPMPHALATHLSGLMPSGEGILVASIESRSPAEKAGLQANDILLTLDGQKLYSPAQLTALVASSDNGKQVEIQLIRKGRVTSLQAEIGKRPARFQQPRRDFIPPMMRPPLPGQQPVPRLQQPSLAWDSFESVEVKTLEDGRYHAAVSFKDQNNEVKNFTFVGKKEEIIKQINQQKGLPKEKREALLNALNLDQGNNFNPFNAPWMQRNPFNDPFFRNGPVGDSFLRDPFFNNTYPQFKSPFFDRFKHPQLQQPNWRYQR